MAEALAENRPYPDEIRQKFIITARYGKPGFPSGMGATLVICRVSCISFDGVAWTNIFIHRNTHDKHAETLVIEKLEEMGRNAKEINIELIQNYSPCNNYERDVNNVLYGCATDIVDYKNKMEKQGKTIDIKITFANFYKVVKCGGGSQKNIEGLRLLQNNGVELRLLQGEQEWRKFLEDDNLVNLPDDNRKTLSVLLEMATSSERKAREEEDREILYKQILLPSDAGVVS